MALFGAKPTAMDLSMKRGVMSLDVLRESMRLLLGKPGLWHVLWMTLASCAMACSLDEQQTSIGTSAASGPGISQDAARSPDGDPDPYGADGAGDTSLLDEVLCQRNGDLTLVSPAPDCLIRSCGDPCTMYDVNDAGIAIPGTVFRCDLRRQCVPTAE